MVDEDYELLPHAELDFLRKEVDKLKRNPLGDTQASISLLDGINELNGNINSLIQIFQSANDDMARLARDGNVIEQMQKLRAENAKIANGIVALSDMLNNKPKQMQLPPQIPVPAPEPQGLHDEFIQNVNDEPNPFSESPMPVPGPPAQNEPPVVPPVQNEPVDVPAHEDLEPPKVSDQITGEPLPPPPRQ